MLRVTKPWELHERCWPFHRIENQPGQVLNVPGNHITIYNWKTIWAKRCHSGNVENLCAEVKPLGKGLVSKADLTLSHLPTAVLLFYMVLYSFPNLNYIINWKIARNEKKGSVIRLVFNFSTRLSMEFGDSKLIPLTTGETTNSYATSKACLRPIFGPTLGDGNSIMSLWPYGNVAIKLTC